MKLETKSHKSGTIFLILLRKKLSVERQRDDENDCRESRRYVVISCLIPVTTNNLSITLCSVENVIESHWIVQVKLKSYLLSFRPNPYHAWKMFSVNGNLGFVGLNKLLHLVENSAWMRSKSKREMVEHKSKKKMSNAID